MRDGSGVLDVTETAVRAITVIDQPALGRRYHPTNAAEVAEAKALFDRLHRQGYFAYREDGLGGGGEVVTAFDESAPSITLVPQMIGG